MNIDDLIEQLNSENETDRKFAIEDICESRSLEGLPFVLNCLQDFSVSVRETVIDNISKFSISDVGPMLVPIIASENVAARNAALDIMQSYGVKSYSLIDEHLLRSNHHDLKKFGLDLVLKIGDVDFDRDKAILGSVHILLNDENQNVAGAAIEVAALKPGLINLQMLNHFIGKGSWLETIAIMAMIRLKATDALKHWSTQMNRLEKISQITLKGALKGVA